MFAVIKTGGKQYRVSEGQELTVEKLATEAGEQIQFNEVLILGGDETRIGTPRIEDAAVQAEVLAQTRGAKIYNFKKRRRKHGSKRLKGHRQDLTTVRVTAILASGAEATGVKAVCGAASQRRPASEASPAPRDAPTKPAPAKPAPADAPAAEVPAPAAPANLLEAAEGAPDDLTRIGGVGPKLQEKLNAAGVFHFRQIADWGSAEIAYMDDRLSSKGRIERDDWVGQAKALMSEQNGGAS